MPKLSERLRMLWMVLRLRLRGTGQITLRSMAKTLAAAKGGITE